MKPLLEFLAKFWLWCGFVTWAFGFYQQCMMGKHWRSDLRRRGGLFSIDAFIDPFFSSNVSDEVRARRRKVNISMLVFFTFLALEFITIIALGSITAPES
jgi:hypothetical protein